MAFKYHSYKQNLAEHNNVRQLEQSDRNVNISKLKAFVEDSLPVSSTLRTIITNEDNELSIEIFLARLPIWLQLSKLENSGNDLSMNFWRLK